MRFICVGNLCKYLHVIFTTLSKICKRVSQVTINNEKLHLLKRLDCHHPVCFYVTLTSKRWFLRLKVLNSMQSIIRKLTSHSFENWQDHIESRPFSRIFVHANRYQFRHVWRYTWFERYPQTLQRNPHSDFHRTLIGERYFPRRQFPQQDGVAPHIGGFPISVGYFLL